MSTEVLSLASNSSFCSISAGDDPQVGFLVNEYLWLHYFSIFFTVDIFLSVFPAFRASPHLNSLFLCSTCFSILYKMCLHLSMLYGLCPRSLTLQNHLKRPESQLNFFSKVFMSQILAVQIQLAHYLSR